MEGWIYYMQINQSIHRCLLRIGWPLSVLRKKGDLMSEPKSDFREVKRTIKLV